MVIAVLVEQTGVQRHRAEGVDLVREQVSILDFYRY